MVRSARRLGSASTLASIREKIVRITLGVLFVAFAAVPLLSAEDAKSPPKGWKDYTAKGNSFSCWLPTEKGILRDSFKDRSPKRGMKMRFASVLFQPKDGPTYEAGTVTVIPYAGAFTKLKSTERVDFMRDLLVELSKGKASGEKELKQGRVPGREFIIETGTTFTRHRVYQYVDRFFLMSVTGTKEQIEAKKATTFLDSYKIPDRYTGLESKGKDK
jgi:hypothetical protein